MVNLNFDKETGILVCDYSYSVEATDVNDFMEFMETNKDLPPNLKVLHNSGSVGTSMRVKDILKYAKIMRRATDRFVSVRAAVYTTHPLSLTLSKMYEKVNFSNNTKYKTFNSERAAIAWLLSI